MGKRFLHMDIGPIDRRHNMLELLSLAGAIQRSQALINSESRKRRKKTYESITLHAILQFDQNQDHEQRAGIRSKTSVGS